MSALAIILAERGFKVSGSDCNLKQKSIAHLLNLGCSVRSADEGLLPHGTNIVVYSAAIDEQNEELAQARSRGLHIMRRSELLAELFNTTYGIAVAGAHGKTTTSSLIAHIFCESGYEPSFAIGGHLHNYATNARAGKSNFFIAEVCENDRTIVLVHPKIALITNIDREHLDVYKDLDEIKAAFRQYLMNAPTDGVIVACHDDQHTMSLVQELSPQQRQRTITYGFSSEADIFATDYTINAEYSTATVWAKGSERPIGTFTLQLPGKHNLLNSLAALATARTAGISFEHFGKACKTFKGIDRRFTLKGFYRGAELFDDYGHHPAEIEQILKVARTRAEKAQGRLIVMFQPHRFSRTEKLWDEFIAIFTQSAFDTLIMTDIYPAFEQAIPGISSTLLVDALRTKTSREIIYVPEDPYFEGAHRALDTVIRPHDVVLFLGAGKINTLAERITSQH